MYYIDYSKETIIPKISYHHAQRSLLIVNPESLVRYTEIICTDENCRYPQLALRIMNHIFAEIDKHNKWSVSARQISKRFDVHYDTVTKCLKYLRSINVLKSDQ